MARSHVLLCLGIAALFSGSPVVATAHDAPPDPNPLGARSASAAPLVRNPLDLDYRSPSFSDPIAVPAEVAAPFVLGVAEEVLPAALAESAPAAAASAGGYGLLQR